METWVITSVGGLISAMFWRILSRMEKKLDRIEERMVNQEECERKHQEVEEMLWGHRHEDGVVVVKVE